MCSWWMSRLLLKHHAPRIGILHASCRPVGRSVLAASLFPLGSARPLLCRASQQCGQVQLGVQMPQVHKAGSIAGSCIAGDESAQEGRRAQQPGLCNPRQQGPSLHQTTRASVCKQQIIAGSQAWMTV